jgi:acetyl esterase/lipase
MKKYLLSLALLGSTLFASAQPGQGMFGKPSVTPQYANINYAGDNMEAHQLDIYIPKDGAAKHKVVVIIYGSAWMANNMKGMAFMSIGKPLVDAGFAVVSINHRSSSDAKWPAQINDVKAAIRYIRGNAQKYGLDTSFIGITGFSSGGHLSAMAGTSNGVKTKSEGKVTVNIEGDLGQYTQESSDVDAVVDWFGPVDMTRMEKCSTVKDAHSPEAALIGGNPADNMDMVKLCSPIYYITSTGPKFIVIHGNTDPVVPYCQSEYFAAALKKAGRLQEFVTVPNGQHGPVTFNEGTFLKMVDFMKAEAAKK